LFDNWFVIAIALGYLLLLFVIAEYGERYLQSEKSRPWIYSLSLAVYCTSWAMYGTVAQSQSTGWYLAPTYAGSILLFIFAWPLLLKIIQLAKKNNITSIADFIAGRFGGSHLLGGLVVFICIVAIVPYISLQLKAIVNSFLLVSTATVNTHDRLISIDLWQDTALYVVIILAIFTILFGTRKIDATEHHRGVMLAIAFEAMIKLIAFFAVGIMTVYFLFDGFADLWQQANNHPEAQAILNNKQPSFIYLTQVLLGMIAILCLPRQFHVLVVENRSQKELMSSRWIFPGYLLLINLFILPIALAGTIYFQDGTVAAEDYILLLPVLANTQVMSLFVFIGGISAATGMIIVATIVLSTMISNEIYIPFSVKFFSFKLKTANNIGRHLLYIRRIFIVVILFLSYSYYRAIAVSEQLAATGLLSMALIAQLAPALIIGIYWKRCNQQATIAGLIAGLVLWAYTLLLPLLASAGMIPLSIIDVGPWGIELLKPTQLFGLYGFDTITHGVVWSLSVNLFLLIYLSLKNEQSLNERVHTGMFLSTNSRELNHSSAKDYAIGIEELVLLAERFMGKVAAEKAFDQFCFNNNIDTLEQANIVQLTGYTEHLLQAIIGSTSTRLIFESLANDQTVPFDEVVNIIDEAADVLLFNRELLQSAIENISHGISVVDKDLRLVAWNNQYVRLFDYPEQLIKVGQPIEKMVRFNAEKGIIGEGNIEQQVAKRLEYMRVGSPHVYERKRGDGIVLEMRGNPMPGGGFVTSFIDITEFRNQQNELQQINVDLEQRVATRTEELEKLNHQFLEAKSMAELANHSKTRFLAAASHDVLQPLNAASLFSATLFEKINDEQQKNIALRIQQALHSAEQLLKDLIEISKLDSDKIEATPVNFSIAELMLQLTQEFQVLAKEKGIILRTVYCNLTTCTDRTMLRRVLQNLLSNAINHSKSKTILFGCKRHEGALHIHVIDQGKGIDESEQEKIFTEFVQLDSDTIAVEGHGLGLAIVSRILQILKLPLQLKSNINKGSNFFISVPIVNKTGAYEEQAQIESVQFDNKHKSAGDKLIVIIDNEQEILDGMTSLLETWGYRNLMVSLDGDFTQYKHYRSENVALIMADYHLENNKTGVEVITQIRTEAKWDVPAVVISADQTEGVKRELQENSIFLLNKPIKPLSLRTLLNRLM